MAIETELEEERVNKLNQLEQIEKLEQAVAELAGIKSTAHANTNVFVCALQVFWQDFWKTVFSKKVKLERRFGTSSNFCQDQSRNDASLFVDFCWLRRPRFNSLSDNMSDGMNCVTHKLWVIND